MEISVKKKTVLDQIKNFGEKISDDNLFLLSSSISYYSALALAPFALILLSIASFLGPGMQTQIVKQASTTISPQLGQLLKTIFDNVNEGVNIGSVSGIIGGIVLLSTASMVFLQFRYSFDVIYGHYNSEIKKTFMDSVKEKLFAMFVVFMAAVLFIASIFGTTIFFEVFGGGHNKLLSTMLVFYVNFMIYLFMFTGIHYFAPSKRPEIYTALKTATLSAVFFMIGNIVLASYLKRIAADSVYGAAGSLLVFLTWAYYSSFTIFLSVEVFTHLRRMKRIR